MKHCIKCKNKDTSLCAPCDNGSYWRETKDSFPIIISSVMFGCGMGGVLAAVYAIVI